MRKLAARKARLMPFKKHWPPRVMLKMAGGHY
jgi:hypothetical protein